VVNEKFTDKRIDQRAVRLRHRREVGRRISNNGEFIHANPASSDAQGSAEVTHGCVNLSVDDATASDDTVLYGDPVEVTGTTVPLSARDGDIWDWTLSWEQWQVLPAL
jgi:hypothetical protein